ncbi:unnamed protein product [Protopolystoma xenopodis]|uniref:Uncharacterized protein n=1 Tax=Protopolystoma xenopodis TaxID=117903 RepID=A0A448XRH7_9PLAT|nr:unnamed protein product [Protopolystoma xenopodis]
MGKLSDHAIALALTHRRTDAQTQVVWPPFRWQRNRHTDRETEGRRDRGTEVQRDRGMEGGKDERVKDSMLTCRGRGQPLDHLQLATGYYRPPLSPPLFFIRPPATGHRRPTRFQSAGSAVSFSSLARRTGLDLSRDVSARLGHVLLS